MDWLGNNLHTSKWNTCLRLQVWQAKVPMCLAICVGDTLF